MTTLKHHSELIDKVNAVNDIVAFSMQLIKLNYIQAILNGYMKSVFKFR